jgi:hypothetical protein
MVKPNFKRNILRLFFGLNATLKKKKSPKISFTRDFEDINKIILNSRAY